MTLGQHPMRHQDGFGGGRSAVVHAGVGDLEAGQLRDKRLEFEDRLSGALTDLGLVRRVAGSEFRACGNRAHGRRYVVAVVAAAEKADETARALIARRERCKFGRDFGLGTAWCDLDGGGVTQGGGDVCD